MCAVGSSAGSVQRTGIDGLSLSSDLFSFLFTGHVDFIVWDVVLRLNILIKSRYITMLPKQLNDVISSAPHC